MNRYFWSVLVCVLGLCMVGVSVPTHTVSAQDPFVQHQNLMMRAVVDGNVARVKQLLRTPYVDPGGYAGPGGGPVNGSPWKSYLAEAAAKVYGIRGWNTASPEGRARSGADRVIPDYPLAEVFDAFFAAGVTEAAYDRCEDSFSVQILANAANGDDLAWEMWSRLSGITQPIAMQPRAKLQTALVSKCWPSIRQRWEREMITSKKWPPGWGAVNILQSLRIQGLAPADETAALQRKVEAAQNINTRQPLTFVFCQMVNRGVGARVSWDHQSVTCSQGSAPYSATQLCSKMIGPGSTATKVEVAGVFVATCS